MRPSPGRRARSTTPRRSWRPTSTSRCAATPRPTRRSPTTRRRACSSATTSSAASSPSAAPPVPGWRRWSTARRRPRAEAMAATGRGGGDVRVVGGGGRRNGARWLNRPMGFGPRRTGVVPRTHRRRPRRSGCRLLFAGINPGLWTAATQTHFNHPGNRFYPALYAAGLIDIVVDRGRAMTDDERQHLVGRGIGITNLVTRATARADELTGEELRAGARRLEATVTSGARGSSPWPASPPIAPRSDGRAAVGGCQHETLAGAELWVVPNPSGLNAHATGRHARRGLPRGGDGGGYRSAALRRR